MQITKIKSGDVRTWKNYESFVQQSFAPSDMSASERSSRRKESDRENWAGGSWEYASNLAPIGDVAHAKSLRANILKEASRVMGQVPRLDPVYRDDGGIWIDVSRYLSGEPEAFGDMVDQNANRNARQISIIVECVCSSIFTAKQYEKAGTIIAGAILGLKAAGYFVSLHIAYKTEREMLNHTLAFPLTGRTGFDVAKLAAVFTPWFFRRTVFSIMETMDESFRQRCGVSDGGGYGRVGRIYPEEEKLIAGHDKNKIISLTQVIRSGEDEIRAALIPKELTNTRR